MKDKKFIQTLYPSARCIKGSNLSDSTFNTEGKDGTHYVIYATDAQNREYMLGISLISEDDAWTKIADTFRNKMLAKLEDNYGDTK
jgi:hypothetical protein